MGTLLNPSLAHCCNEAIASHIATHQPRLNFEINDMEPDSLVDVLTGLFQSWSCEHFLWTKVQGITLRIYVVHKSELDQFVRRGLDGAVVSLVNPFSLGGVTFDLDLDAARTFTLTAWGSEAEGVVSALSQVFPSGTQFRGN